MAVGSAQVFSDLSAKLLQPISGFIDTAISNLQSSLAGPLKAAMVIYVMWFGWQLMTGAVQSPMAEMAKRALRIGLLLMLVLNAGSEGGYATFVKAPLLTDIPNFVSSAVVSAKFDDKNGMVFDDLVNQAAIAAARMRGSASAWSVGASVGAHIQSYILEGIAYLTAAVGFYYVMYAKLVLGLLLSIGPVFIAMALFDSTRRFFDGWLSQCANFIILQILIATVCAVLVAMMKTALGGTFGPDQPGAMASALVTCIVMMMVFHQLPHVSHALAHGGASLSLPAVPGLASARRAVGNAAGDVLSAAINAAHQARAPATPAPAGAPARSSQKTWSNWALTRAPADSRGPFRDHRNYNGRSRTSRP